MGGSPDTTPFAEAYASGQFPDRFVLPTSASICGAGEGVNWQIVCAYADKPWNVTYRAFYFPGWSCSINGQPTEIAPTPRNGLITFQVSQGEVISVFYEGTTIQHLAEWISIASALVITGVLIFGFVRRSACEACTCGTRFDSRTLRTPSRIVEFRFIFPAARLASLCPDRFQSSLTATAYPIHWSPISTARRLRALRIRRPFPLPIKSGCSAMMPVCHKSNAANACKPRSIGARCRAWKKISVRLSI